ncbi:MAG TPA: hypothetical protein VNQ76_13775 [Planctomicrobium sp.]|nr:hypothetical protein [Planctomicrobium sp.]
MAGLLALEWLPDRLDALSADGHAARLETVDHVDPMISPVQIGESIRVWLRREGINADRVTVVLPRELVVVRRLQLPACPENELPDLVRFQAATKTSVPIEKLVLDYLPVSSSHGEEGQGVITITFDRDRLHRIQTVCAAAGLELEKVTLSALEIGRLIRSSKASDLGMSGPDLVLHQQETRLELSIFDEGTLVFCHPAQLPQDESGDVLKTLTTELTRSLMSLGQSNPNASVVRCFYVCGNPNPDIISLLQDRYGAGLSVIEASSVGKKTIPIGYESLAGVFLPGEPSHLKLDLLHPREKYIAPDRRKLYITVATGIIALAVLAGGSVYYTTQLRLNTEAADLRNEVEKQTKQLDDGKPRLQAYNKIALWKASDTAPIPLWAAFREKLPSTDRAYFTEISLTPSSGEILASFSGKGYARNREDIVALNQSLSDQGYQVVAKTPILTPTSGKRDPDYPWQFDLVVNLPRLVARQVIDR